MRVIFSLFICILLHGYKLQAQAPTWQDCLGARVICTNSINDSVSLVGSGTYFPEIDSMQSCLMSGDINSSWYSFTVQNSGQLCLTITPFDLTEDYDWAIYNLTNNTCADIYNTPALEVSCNWDPDPGATGPNGLPGFQNEPCINVLANQNYVLLVSNYTGGGQGYNIKIENNSTAQIFDNVAPVLLSVDTPLACGTDSIVIHFSEFVQCSTVTPGAFSLTGPAGTYTISSVSSSVCSSGGVQDKTFVLKVTGGFNPTGSYQLSLTGGVKDFCQNTATAGSPISFNVYSSFTVTTNSSPAICTATNGTATATANSIYTPYSYFWNSNPSQITQTATGLSAGNYSVTVTDQSGCAVSASVVVAKDDTSNQVIAAISAKSDVSCKGYSDGSATVAAQNGTQPYTYLWSTGSTSASVSNLSAGNYSVTITDKNGCNTTVPLTISEPNQIKLSISKDTIICRGGTATLNASVQGGSSAGFSFQWSNNAGNNPTVYVSPVTTTTYLVWAESPTGCPTDTPSVNVIVALPISVSITGPESICEGDSALFTAVASGGNANYSYAWSNGAGTNNPVYIHPGSTTTYTVTVTDGCETQAETASKQIIVGNYPNFQFTSNVSKGCEPLNVTFTVNPVVASNKYEWNFGDGSPSTISVLSNINHIYYSDGCMDVTLTVTSNLGCRRSITDTCMVDVFPLPAADFNFSPEAPDNLSPIVDFIDNSIGGNSWQWGFGDGYNSGSQNVQHQYKDTGLFKVTLAVENEYGCRDTSVRYIYVDYKTTIYFPNSFTPNDDGLNDAFGPISQGVQTKDFKLLVFARSGDLVYETDNPDHPWDGTDVITGGKYPTDTYVYRVYYRTFKGQKRELYGYVNLIR